MKFQFTLGNHEAGGGGSSQFKSVMVHLDYAKDKAKEGYIEELFLHESAHACLDQIIKVHSKFNFVSLF